MWTFCINSTPVCGKALWGRSWIACLKKYAQNKWNPWSLYFKITSKLFEILVNLPNPTQMRVIPKYQPKESKTPIRSMAKPSTPPSVFFQQKEDQDFQSSNHLHLPGNPGSQPHPPTRPQHAWHPLRWPPGHLHLKIVVSWLCFLPEKNNPTVGCPGQEVRIKGDRMSVG